MDNIIQFYLHCLLNNDLYKIKEKHALRMGKMIKDIAMMPDYTKKIEVPLLSLLF